MLGGGLAEGGALGLLLGVGTVGRQGGGYWELETSGVEVGGWKSPQLGPARCREDGHPGGGMTMAKGVCGSPRSTMAE